MTVSLTHGDTTGSTWLQMVLAHAEVAAGNHLVECQQHIMAIGVVPVRQAN
jgi:hypothetical protein